MRVIITGAKGGIGSELVRRFTRPENWVDGYDRGEKLFDIPGLADCDRLVIAHGLIGHEEPGDLAAHFQDDFTSAVRLMEEWAKYRTWAYRERDRMTIPQDSRCVVIASNSAQIPRSPSLYYCSMKAAASMATRVMHRKYAAEGIQFFSVCPGLIETERGMAFLDELPEEKRVEQFRRLPYGHAAQVSDITDWVEFLLTAPGAYMAAGEVLQLGGGEH